MRKNEKGFTLIELLAVVVILGLLLAIAIPSITKYITEARRKTLMTTINKYIEASSASVNNGDFIFSENNVIYAIPIECIPMERGGDNPFGEWLQVNDAYWAYVLVQYDYDNFNYIYGFTFKDSAGYGMHPIKQELMSTRGSEIETGFELGRPRTGLYGYFSDEDYWERSGFNVDENTRVKVLLSKSEGIHGDGEDTCTLHTKGTNYEELEEIKNRPGTLINSGSNNNLVFGKEMSRELIESITTKNYVDVPSNAIDSWDISIQKNESVLAWITDSDNDNLYELYLGQEGGVKAPSNSNNLFSNYKNITKIDLKYFDTSNVTNMAYMFSGCSKVTSLDVKSFDTRNVTNMQAMFYNCSSLITLDLRNFDTSKVKNMGNDYDQVHNHGGMFEGCSNLISLNLSSFNTSNVTNMSKMFSGCSSLKNLDLGNFDTSNVKRMSFMFQGCSGLSTLDLSNFDTSIVKNMMYMFSGCNNLISLNLSNWNTSNVTDMMAMFQGCSRLKSLDLSSFDTGNVTVMNSVSWWTYGGMFQGCSSLESLNIDNFDTSKISLFSNMFNGCSSLKTLDLSSFDTSNATDMGNMFSNCSSLNEINISNFDVSTVPNYSNILYRVPISSKIIVKDNTTRNWIHTNINSNLNNIVTIDEIQ